MKQTTDHLKKQSGNSKKGFLLVEVLVVVVLAIVFWAATSQVFFSVRTGNLTNRNLTLAMCDLSMVMERMQTSDRADLLTNFPPNWNNTGNEQGAAWQAASEEVSDTVYTLVGGKKIGDTNSEEIEYLYENYQRNPTDPANATPPDLLEIKLTVSWTEKGQARSQSMRNILN